MPKPTHVPDASRLRLSRYHCFVGGLIASDGAPRMTSHQMAEELGLSEETVRRDLSFIGGHGRPGAGYDLTALYDSLTEYLGLVPAHPFVAVGDRDMLQALSVIFPAEEFGLRPAAYFSPRPADAGSAVEGVTIAHTSEIPALDPLLEVAVALVACSPDLVPETLASLDSAGVHAVLMLTPVLRPNHPAGMDVTYFRIPCALKALASEASAETAPCCVATECVAHQRCSQATT